MAKEIWIVIVAIIILLAPLFASKPDGAKSQILGWLAGLLPKSVATSSAWQSTATETDLWIGNGRGD